MTPGFLTTLPWTAVVDAALRSLLVAGAVAAGLAVLRVRNVVAQKAAWMLVLAASLAMPLLAHWAAHSTWLPENATFVVRFHQWSSSTSADPARIRATTSAWIARQPDQVQPDQPQAAPAYHPSATVRESLPSLPAGDRFPAPAISHVSIESGAPAPIPAPHNPVQIQFSAVSILAMLYLAICGALLVRMAFGTWMALQVWRKGEPVLSLLESVPVRASRQIASPVTVGSGIVLPAGYSAWDAEKLRIVLAHESSHVRQGDFYIQLAASLYTALFWFSPLGWWLKRKLSDLSETISDRAAVSEAASHASYAQVLLDFAALPRPIPIGVAMAHQGRLIPRIERLLNETSFRQAFAGGRARIAAAVLLVPVALFAATAMLRVQAAGQQTPPATAPAPSAQPAEVAPAPQPNATAPSAVEAPAAPASAQSQAAPAAPGSADAAPLPPEGSASAGTAIAPRPPDSDNLAIGPGFGPGGSLWLARQARMDAHRTRLMALTQAGNARGMALAQVKMARDMALLGNGNSFFFGNDGNSYAYVTGEGEKNIHLSGSWFNGSSSKEEIEKARKAAHGDFLWFERDGKSYVIDDPAVLAALKPMQDQMDALGKQQDELGKQQDELGKQQEELGRQMEQVKVPTPDMKKELEKLHAVEAKLAALQGKDASQDQLAEIQGELGDIQGRIGDLQGNMGGRMGELGGKQGELGAQQGKLGAQQGRLGAQQGRIAREMDGKVLTIIDEALKNGKARPVQ